MTTKDSRGTLVDDLKAMSAKINALPPTAHVIRASHAVPYGRCFRQWDTRGRLILWANRGEIADLPRCQQKQHRVWSDTSIMPAFGIPVVVE